MREVAFPKRMAKGAVFIFGVPNFNVLIPAHMRVAMAQLGHLLRQPLPVGEEGFMKIRADVFDRGVLLAIALAVIKRAGIRP